MHIPSQSGHPFQGKAATHSKVFRPLIPREGDRGMEAKGSNRGAVSQNRGVKSCSLQFQNKTDKITTWQDR